MADENYKVAYRCQWCGEGFHQVEDRYSMHPCAIYVDSEGRQFDSVFCKSMYHGGWGEKTKEGKNE
jgi:hypothetical protein